MKRFVIFLILFVNIIIPYASAKDTEQLKLKDFSYSISGDLIESMKWAYQGSYKQFQGTQNLVLTGLAVLSTAYFIHNDERISKNTTKKNSNESLLRFISDSSILFNTPIIPMMFYGVGVSNKNEKMVRFSKEYLAALTLTLLETGVVSMIPVHQRPDQKELSFWETAFRGQSSFPSGHVVGYSVLGMKTFQFYGPLLSIVPFALAAATGFERVHAEKHFMSDVVASGAMSLLASEGVRYASNYNNNHPVYQWIFKHNFSLNYIRSYDIPGLLLSFTY